MNIFVTDQCPYKSASYLDDVRASKMILESAQILSTAVQMHGGKTTYKVTHKNHPAVKWASLNRDNYYWLFLHFHALCARFRIDRGKSHKSEDLKSELLYEMGHIPKGKLTPFVNCARRKDMNIDFTHMEDVHKAYKQYLHYRWKNTDKRPATRNFELINLEEL